MDILADPKVVDPSVNVTVPVAFGYGSLAWSCTLLPHTAGFGFALIVKAPT